MKQMAAIVALVCLLGGISCSTAASAETKDAQLLCLNIGKADCMLLSYDGHHYLIDAGYECTYPALRTALAQSGVDRLDGVFLTHCHSDHFGGLKPLAESNTAVDAWYASAIYYDTDGEKHPAEAAAQIRNTQVTWLSSGQIISVGEDACFRILGPVSVNRENENDNSLVMLFDSPAGSILLTGDMKKDEASELMEAGLIPPCTLLKAAHHGDNNGTSKKLLKAARPEAAVILTSTAEEPDTPAPKVLEQLEKAGCSVYVSQDWQDALRIVLENGKIREAQDLSWKGVPPRAEGVQMTLDLKNDLLTLRNNGSATAVLTGGILYSTRGDEMFILPELELAPGAAWTVGSQSTRTETDTKWNEARVWHLKKRDTAVLYDSYGRPVACTDNGIEE